MSAQTVELRSAAKAIHNTIKVNHAGEYGAIRIYAGQILVSRLLYPDLVDTLSDVKNHEQQHFAVFDDFVRARGVRKCRVFFLWALGGWLLGLMTALCGRQGIRVCTHAVETTVIRHLSDQIAFLKDRDPELCAAIASIKIEEEGHRSIVGAGGPTSWAYRTLERCIGGLTERLIWLSMRL